MERDETVRLPEPKEKKSGVTLKGEWHIIHKDKNGKVLSDERIKNLIVNAWLNELLDIVYNGGAQPTNMYMGLVNGPSPTFDATDIAGSHVGWTENISYSGGARPAWNPDAAASQEVENTTPATFNMTPAGTESIAGLFIITDNSTPGNEATGSLVSEVGFAQGTKNVADGDTLEVTYKQTAASAT